MENGCLDLISNWMLAAVLLDDEDVEEETQSAIDKSAININV
jgi:hypothetical protein